MFALFTYRMNYFILSEESLVIKNPVWFWLRREIYLSDIKQFSIVSPIRTPLTLKLTMNSSNTKSYAASSLKAKTWEKLIVDLSNRGIMYVEKIKF